MAELPPKDHTQTPPPQRPRLAQCSTVAVMTEYPKKYTQVDALLLHHSLQECEMDAGFWRGVSPSESRRVFLSYLRGFFPPQNKPISTEDESLFLKLHTLITREKRRQSSTQVSSKRNRKRNLSQVLSTDTIPGSPAHSRELSRIEVSPPMVQNDVFSLIKRRCMSIRESMEANTLNGKNHTPVFEHLLDYSKDQSIEMNTATTTVEEVSNVNGNANGTQLTRNDALQMSGSPFSFGAAVSSSMAVATSSSSSATAAAGGTSASMPCTSPSPGRQSSELLNDSLWALCFSYLSFAERARLECVSLHFLQCARLPHAVGQLKITKALVDRYYNPGHGSSSKSNTNKNNNKNNPGGSPAICTMDRHLLAAVPSMVICFIPGTKAETVELRRRWIQMVYSVLCISTRLHSLEFRIENCAKGANHSGESRFFGIEGFPNYAIPGLEAGDLIREHSDYMNELKDPKIHHKVGENSVMRKDFFCDSLLGEFGRKIRHIKFTHRESASPSATVRPLSNWPRYMVLRHHLTQYWPNLESIEFDCSRLRCRRNLDYLTDLPLVLFQSFYDDSEVNGKSNDCSSSASGSSNLGITLPKDFDSRINEAFKDFPELASKMRSQKWESQSYRAECDLRLLSQIQKLDLIKITKGHSTMIRFWKVPRLQKLYLWFNCDIPEERVIYSWFQTEETIRKNMFFPSNEMSTCIKSANLKDLTLVFESYQGKANVVLWPWLHHFCGDTLESFTLGDPDKRPVYPIYQWGNNTGNPNTILQTFNSKVDQFLNFSFTRLTTLNLHSLPQQQCIRVCKAIANNHSLNTLLYLHLDIHPCNCQFEISGEKKKSIDCECSTTKVKNAFNLMLSAPHIRQNLRVCSLNVIVNGAISSLPFQAASIFECVAQRCSEMSMLSTLELCLKMQSRAVIPISSEFSLGMMKSICDLVANKLVGHSPKLRSVCFTGFSKLDSSQLSYLRMICNDKLLSKSRLVPIDKSVGSTKRKSDPSSNGYQISFECDD